MNGGHPAQIMLLVRAGNACREQTLESAQRQVMKRPGWRAQNSDDRTGKENRA